MSRFIGTRETTKKFEAIELWKESCLIREGSIFTASNIWTLENIKELKLHFVENLDEGEGSFLERLEKQLSKASTSAKILCAEMLWAMLFSVSNIKVKKKVLNIDAVLKWSEIQIEPTNQFIQDIAYEGFGSGGVGYNNYRWKELVYFILLLEKLLQETESHRASLLNNPRALPSWLESVPDNDNRQFRHMLLYMLFPDNFERVFGNSDRINIVSSFQGKGKTFYRGLSANGLDAELSKIRLDAELKYNSKELDWYNNPLKEIWNGDSSMISGTIKQFIDQANTDDLTTKQYPKKFSELAMKISFGQGNTAKVPWIGFLGGEQTPQKGIYPTILYYKDFNKLFLVRGVSETLHSELIWSGKNLLTVVDWFVENLEAKPPRYGQSFVYKVYDIPLAVEDEELESDVNNLLEEYKNILGEAPLVTTSQELFDANLFGTSSNTAGLLLKRNLSKQFLASIFTKPFTILTGLAGSGKTKLAEALSLWISESDEQRCMVSVGADWTNREPLLGFPNALNLSEYVKPDCGALDLILNANKNPTKPYFLILDEMNMSHVERYFADFLSAMESSDRTIALHSSDKIDEKVVPKSIKLPRNLFIIGTVNIDETTYMFSPKVLDRANVIEFRVSEDEMQSFFDEPAQLDMDSLRGAGASMGESFVAKALEKKTSSPDLAEKLMPFFTELQKVGAEFGYRTASEISQFVTVCKELAGDSMELTEVIDAAIMQKLLPKLHGSRNKIEPILNALIKLCLVDPKIETDIRYPLSHEKLSRMLKRVQADGFTSFAEA